MRSSLSARHLALLVWFVAAWGILSYWSNPLSADPSIHLTGVHQAELKDLPLHQTWTFRGPTYNLYLSVLYQLTTWWVEFNDVAAFSTLAKGLHLAALLAAAGLWGAGTARMHEGLRSFGWALSGLAVLALTSATRTTALHAEDVAAVLLFAATGLAGFRRPGLLLTGGVVASLLPLLKGTTAALCLPALLAVLVRREHRWRSLAIYLLGMALGTLPQAVWIWKHPEALGDLLEAAVYQGSRHTTPGRMLVDFVAKWAVYLSRTPMLGAALASVAYVLPALAIKRRFFELAYLASSWLVVVGLLALQGKYFTYHLSHGAVCMTTSVAWFVAAGSLPMTRRVARVVAAGTSLCGLSLVLALDNPWFEERSMLRAGLVVAITATVAYSLRRAWSSRETASEQSQPFLWGALLVAVWGAFVLPWTTTNLEAGPRAAQRHRMNAQDARRMAKLERKFALDRGPVLFLSYGVVARYSKSTSACRHFFPIPVQRFVTARRTEFEEVPGFIENRDCIFGYQGEWLFLEEAWLFKSGMASELQRFVKGYKSVARIKLERGKRQVRLMRRRKMR